MATAIRAIETRTTETAEPKTELRAAAQRLGLTMKELTAQLGSAANHVPTVAGTVACQPPEGKCL